MCLIPNGDCYCTAPSLDTAPNSGLPEGKRVFNINHTIAQTVVVQGAPPVIQVVGAFWKSLSGLAGSLELL